VNCQDMNHLIDSTADDLTSAQRESIDRHLASCHACSEDWTNWREMAALPIPATPVMLRGRIAAALPARISTPGRRNVQPFVIGGVLLACAAAAATLLVQYAQRDQEPASGLVESSQAVAPARQDEVPATSMPVSSSDLPPDTAIAVPEKPVAVAEGPMDPRSIVVLLRPEAAADLRAVAIARQCHDAIVRQLRAVKGLNILAGAAVSAYEGDEQASRLAPGPAARYSLRLSDKEIARKLGAGHVVVVTTDNDCAATQFNAQTGESVAGSASGTALPPEDGWTSFATHLAKVIRDKTLMDGSTLLAEYRKTLLTTTLGDNERVAALSKIANSALKMGKTGLRGVLDKEVIAAAVQIGTKSPDAHTRSGVWAFLRGIEDSSLAQPLMQALANDPDATVRMQAAFALNTFLDVPGVREALLRAASEDSSREPEVACCIWTVREAAERASIADQDMKAWVRSRLHNESLPARSRLLDLQAIVPDGRFGALVSVADMGTDAPRVIFDIGRNEQNPKVRQMAWRALQFAAPDEAFLPVLLGDLTSHPDEYVRAGAAQVVANYASNSAAHDALDRARSDSSIWVRRAAGSALEKSGN
jgi:hypothetical protein